MRGDVTTQLDGFTLPASCSLTCSIVVSPTCIEDVPVAGMQKGEQDWIRRKGRGRDKGPKVRSAAAGGGRQALEENGGLASQFRLLELTVRDSTPKPTSSCPEAKIMQGM